MDAEKHWRSQRTHGLRTINGTPTTTTCYVSDRAVRRRHNNRDRSC